jgi:sensor c-di-GMP phosphodiesterase-like protein
MYFHASFIFYRVKIFRHSRRRIVELSAALRLRTVAEGVETWEEAFFLRAAGVDCGQGWFWSKAVSALEASRVLSDGYPQSQARRG